MTLLLGICSIVQVAFLPGYVFTLAFMRRRRCALNGILQLLAAFCVSWFFNYLMVGALVIFHVYKRPVVLAIFLIEALLALWLRWFAKEDRNPSPVSTEDLILEFFESPNKTEKLLRLAIFSLFAMAFIMSLYYVMQGVGQIFSHWDTLFSWNRWAVDWAQNQFPRSVYRFPQLLPANWSLTYVFIGNEKIQFFASFLPATFLFFCSLAFFFVGLNQKSFAVLAGGIATFYLYRVFLQPFFNAGYADLPSSFFSTISFLALMTAFWGNVEKKEDFILFGALTSATAAITKQSGLFIFISYPLLAIGFRRLTKASNVQSLRRVFIFWLTLAFLIVIPWYASREFAIHELGEASERPLNVGGSFGSKSVSERIADSVVLIRSRFNNPLKIMILSVCIASLASIFGRTILFPYAVCFTLLWSMLFSYDPRNLAAVLPFWGLSFGFGLKSIVDWFLSNARAMKFAKIGAPALVILLLIGLSFTVNEQMLLGKQQLAQRQLGDPVLNAKIISRKQSGQLTGKLVTNYPFFQFIDELKNDVTYVDCFDLARVEKQLKAPSDKSELIVIWKVKCSPEVLIWIRQMIADGSLRTETEDSEYIFLTREGA